VAETVKDIKKLSNVDIGSCITGIRGENRVYLELWYVPNPEQMVTRKIMQEECDDHYVNIRWITDLSQDEIKALDDLFFVAVKRFPELAKRRLESHSGVRRFSISSSNSVVK